MAVSATGSAVSAYTTPSTTSTTSQTETDRTALDKDDFLKLFVTSLQYQDPMSPMENSEMMQQMSQLGMMEAVTNMKETVTELSENMLGSQVQQGSSLLGKTIKGIDSEGKAVNGVAEKVQVNDGVISLLVNNKTVQLGKISEVTQ
jgi:flagellar basal-body rod modification protein FlgD